MPQSNDTSLIPDLGALPTGNVAYYYCLINRTDSIRSGDLDRPWSQIKLKWGDQYMAPHTYGFFAFAVARARRTGEKIDDVIDSLREVMKRDVLEQHSHYNERNADPQSWQDLHGRDILAFWHDDPDQTTKDGKERIRMIRDVFPEVDGLARILIPGPNKNNIYVLAEQEHMDLFNRQLRRTVEGRIKVLERVTRARRYGERLLEKRNKVSAQSLFFQDGDPSDSQYVGLTPNEIKLLQRGAHWLDKGEEELKAEGDREYYLGNGEGNTSFEFGANVLPLESEAQF